MSAARTARVTVDGVEATLRTERGGSYALGNEHLPFEVHALTLRGAPWCTVAVHRRPGAEVTAELAPGPGPRAKAPEARRAVEVRFWLTPEEASRVGLAGAGRNEAARARLLTPEGELACHPIDHLNAVLAAIHKDGNGSYLVSDGKGAVALVTRNFSGTAWERELAESAVSILSAIREAIQRNLDEGQEFGEGGQARSAIAYDLTESSALDEVIRLAAGGSDVR